MIFKIIGAFHFMFTMTNNKLVIFKSYTMAVRLWVTCLSLIMIFLNKTFFVRKYLIAKVLESEF